MSRCQSCDFWVVDDQFSGYCNNKGTYTYKQDYCEDYKHFKEIKSLAEEERDLAYLIIVISCILIIIFLSIIVRATCIAGIN